MPLRKDEPIVPRRISSADRQIHAYQRALTKGADEKAALIAVVDFLVQETMRVLDTDPKGLRDL